MMQKPVQLLGIGMMVVLVFTSCNSKKKEDDQDKKVKTYKILTLTTKDITLNTAYPATLQGRQNVEIRPKIDGYIEAIYVDEGATVKKGQLLFRISNPQYVEAVRDAHAAIGSAEAAVETAQLEVEKVKPLVEKAIVSQYELESAKLALKSKKAALIQAKATLANAKANLGYSRVASPANGVIGLIPYKVGALVSSSSSEPLTTVSDISEIYSYFSLNEKQLLSIERNSTGKTFAEKLHHIPAVSLILSDGSRYDKKGKVTIMMTDARISVINVIPETGFVPTMAMALAATVVNRKAMIPTTKIPTTACSRLKFITPKKKKTNTANKQTITPITMIFIGRSRCVRGSMMPVAADFPPLNSLEASPTADLMMLHDLMIPMIPAMAIPPIPM